MKTLKRFLVLIACLGLFVSLGNDGQFETSDGVSTCAILEEDVVTD